MDIYFKEEYAKIYELNGDGKVEKFNYECKEGRVEYIFLKKLEQKNIMISRLPMVMAVLFFSHPPRKFK